MADTNVEDSLFINLHEVFDYDKVAVQHYRSRWSFDPFLESTHDISAEEREYFEELERQLKELSTTRPTIGPPLPKEDLQKIVRFFFPPFKRQFRFGALCRPMSPAELIVTPAWCELLMSGHLQSRYGEMGLTATTRAGLHILHAHYAQDLQSSTTEQLNYRHSDTGLTSYLRVVPGFDYVRVHVDGERPKLSQREIRELLQNIDDPELWTRKLPPDVFHFSGFELNHVVDVTPEIAKDKLQTLLLKREAVLSDSRLRQLESVLGNYLRVPDLKIGVQALDYPRDNAVAHRYLIRQDLLADEIEFTLDPAFGNTIYRNTCSHGQIRIYDDLHDYTTEESPLEKLLVDKGYRSLVLVPLYGKGKNIMGMLELASERPFAFSNLVLYHLESIAPLFRQAVRRSRVDMEARIQSTMRTNFTALDPSIEWRFIQAAAELIDYEQNHEEGEALLPEIRFEDVWALYAQADIVGSSKMRNEAIRSDLLIKLNAAHSLLTDPAIDLRFPLAGKLVHDIEDLKGALSKEMSPNDEQRVIDFLHHDFQPTLTQLEEMPGVCERAKAYHERVEDARTDDMTHQEAYEVSVRKLTRVINGVITDEQAEAQRIVPHYFNKYRTDGVEFNIYAGQSLLQSGTFSKIHLQNLRLWQLQTMVYVTKAAAGLRDKLPVALSTAQLIFVFGNSITIQFRMDEKRFDVEGAYNVRYEVIKKRIDKALVRGSEERLTVADHIAIVYSHHSDKRMYHEFIQYLNRKNSVVGKAEDLELEPMQGVDGLNAIRVKVV